MNKTILLLLLFSCARNHVNRPTTPLFAPKGYNGIGFVKYSIQGDEEDVNDRREDAFREMFIECGEYKIVKEGPEDTGEMGTSIGRYSFSSKFQYWHIYYQCITKKYEEKKPDNTRIVCNKFKDNISECLNLGNESCSNGITTSMLNKKDILIKCRL